MEGPKGFLSSVCLGFISVNLVTNGYLLTNVIIESPPRERLMKPYKRECHRWGYVSVQGNYICVHEDYVSLHKDYVSVHGDSRLYKTGA